MIFFNFNVMIIFCNRFHTSEPNLWGRHLADVQGDVDFDSAAALGAHALHASRSSASLSSVREGEDPGGREARTTRRTLGRAGAADTLR